MKDKRVRYLLAAALGALLILNDYVRRFNFPSTRRSHTKSNQRDGRRQPAK